MTPKRHCKASETIPKPAEPRTIEAGRISNSVFCFRSSVERVFSDFIPNLGGDCSVEGTEIKSETKVPRG